MYWDSVSRYSISDTYLSISCVSEPQGYDPKITFGKAEYQVGEVLEANCTTSPARPPPHITWFINKQKVSASLIGIAQRPSASQIASIALLIILQPDYIFQHKAPLNWNLKSWVSEVIGIWISQLLLQSSLFRRKTLTLSYINQMEGWIKNLSIRLNFTIIFRH